jgi:predicted DNA-binding protein
MEYPKLSFRIAPEIATRLEEEATNRELTTSELVREIVTAHYEKSDAAQAGRTESVANEADTEKRFQQLIFEIGKTRSALLRIGLQTISEETMEQILAAATDDAKNYAALVAGIDRLTAEPGEQGDASGS